MHELAITQGILDQSLAEAQKHGAARIKLIKLQIGEAMSIVPECVQFYFDQMKQGTLADQAELKIEVVPLRLRCPKCHSARNAECGMRNAECESRPELGLDCGCNAGIEITSGRELLIEYLEIEP